MNFIKLVFAEIKKIFLKPTIIVLTGLLVAVLCINGFAYNPKNKSNEIVSISGSSVTEIKNKFYGTSGTYTKQSYDNILNNDIYSYIIVAKSDNSSVKLEIIDLINNIEQYEGSLNNYVNQSASTEILYSVVTNLSNEIQNFLSVLNAELNKSAPKVIIKNNHYKQLTEQISAYKRNLSSITPASLFQQYSVLNAQIKSYKYTNKFSSLLSKNLIPVSISNDVVTKMNYYYNESIDRLNAQNQVINNFENSQLSIPISNFKIEITKYIHTVEQTKTIISSLFVKSIASSPADYFNFTNYNAYYNNYTLTESCYLFDNNLFSFEVATSFNTSTTSNTLTNAYDFMFNSMQILLFIIVIFSIIIATSSIANEFSSGTIKLLLIRPFSRNKILFAKLISSLLISMLFIIVSCAFSLLIGGIMFGFESLPMLVVFNASSAFTINPFLLTLIYIACAIIQCLIYILISLFIAVIFKNSIFSVVISLCLFFAGIICNLFVSFNSWAIFLPYPNFNLFNYFMPTTSNTQIGNLFNGNYSLISFIISLIYIVVLSLAVSIPTFKIFKKQDI